MFLHIVLLCVVLEVCILFALTIGESVSLLVGLLIVVILFCCSALLVT